MFNSTARITDNRLSYTSKTSKEVQQTTESSKDFRCWLTQTSIAVEKTAIGQAATRMYRARFTQKSDIKIGSKLEIKKDNEDDFFQYEITRLVNNGYHYDAILLRIFD